jgi:predicted DNA-binding antitoxin AbrB/MazE fold protein
MTITLQAIYEQGTLRLMQPLDLPEGTPVQVIITANDLTREDDNEETATQELLAIPGFIGALEEAERDIAEDKLTDWRDVRKDV